jgi:hypothetical protein
VRGTILIRQLLGLLWVATAQAHHPEKNAEWFNSLHSKSGYSCCTGSDAEVISDADWDSMGDRYRVRIDEHWYTVEADAVVTVPNLAGHTLVWPQRDAKGKVVRIRCFLPGEMI